MIDKETFIERYCEDSGISWKFLEERRKVVSCTCGDILCEGWAMVPKDPDIIQE